MNWYEDGPFIWIDDPDEDPIYPKWTITAPGVFEIPDE